MAEDQKNNSNDTQQEGILEKFLQNDKLKNAAIELAVKQGTYAIEKYKKKSSIVEEGVLHLYIVLDVEDGHQPLVEIMVDDLFLGYINEKKKKTNKSVFKVECYKRGDGKWDEHEIKANPVRDFAKYFHSGQKKARFAQTPEDSSSPVPVYIGIKRLRNWRGKPKAIPQILNPFKDLKT